MKLSVPLLPNARKSKNPCWKFKTLGVGTSMGGLNIVVSELLVTISAFDDDTSKIVVAIHSINI